MYGWAKKSNLVLGVEICMCHPDHPISGSGQLERQSDAIHAVSQAGRLRTIIEYMPKMPAAAHTMDGGAVHAEGRVRCRANSLIQRRPEARPTRSTLELRVRGKQTKFASRAGEDSAPVLAEQRTREWSLRGGLAQYRVLDRCQQLAPFHVAVHDLERLSGLRDGHFPGY